MMGYLTTSELDQLITLPSDLTTTNKTQLITFCTAILNRDINVRIVREKVAWLDEVRENDIDGTNTTYYVKNWKNWYFGDRDDDGDVDTSDVIVYQVDSDDVETELTVSTITHDEGKLVLSSAPAGSVDLYITYMRAPVDESTPDNMIKIALAQLVGAYAFLKIDPQKISKFKVGKVSVMKQSDGFNIMHTEYRKTLNRINERVMEAGEGKVPLKVE